MDGRQSLGFLGCRIHTAEVSNELSLLCIFRVGEDKPMRVLERQSDELRLS